LGAFSLLGANGRQRIVSILFYIGFFFLLSDLVGGAQIGQLVGQAETPREPMSLTIFEIALAIGLVISAIKIPWGRVRNFASVFVIVFFLSQLFVIGSGLSKDIGENRLEAGKTPAKTVQEKVPSLLSDKGASMGNVYQLVFDAYSSTILLPSLKELGLLSDFDGFTFFENNRANYTETRLSVPSFMMGEFHEGNGNLTDWVSHHKTSGIVRTLYESGFNVYVYARNRERHAYKEASYSRWTGDIIAQWEVPLALDHLEFADLWLLRVAPNFLQREVYRRGEGLFSRLFLTEEMLAFKGSNKWAVSSVELMQELIKDEFCRPSQGEYVYAFIWIPHGPYVIGRDCNCRRGSLGDRVFKWKDTAEIYREQALCATKLMWEFITTLKQTGKYHNSTIIIQSDHGLWQRFAEDPESTVPSDLIEDMHGLAGINSRTNALLLVKPRGSSGHPIVVSQRRTQLADIPATIYDLLDIPTVTEQGISVFSNEFPDDRKIHIFTKRPKGLKGYQYASAKEEMLHLTWRGNSNWAVYQNIVFREIER
jgi:hypothetical protein